MVVHGSMVVCSRKVVHGSNKIVCGCIRAVNNHWTELVDWTTGLHYFATKMNTPLFLNDDNSLHGLISYSRTVASSLEVVRPYGVVITTTPTSAHSLVQVPHKCGTAMAVPAL